MTFGTSGVTRRSGTIEAMTAAAPTASRLPWLRFALHYAEMVVAMFVPYWLGALSGHGLMMLGHILMFPAMLAAMLWRRPSPHGR
jgi:flagellar biosynthetic protein FliP